MAETTGLDHTEILAELVALDLAHNHIRSEKDIDDLTVLPKLEQLSLYGNPLLGSTGEDPVRRDGKNANPNGNATARRLDGAPPRSDDGGAQKRLKSRHGRRGRGREM